MKILLTSTLTLCLAIAKIAVGATGLPQDPIAVETWQWRTSVKVLVDDEGDWPHPSAWPRERQADLHDLVEEFDNANRALARTNRNVRLDLVEVIELRGLNFWNASIVGGNTLVPRSCRDALVDLEMAAKSDPVQYAYREDAINVYILLCSDGFGGLGALPDDGNIVVLNHPLGRSVLIHEIGHHFALRHTHWGISRAISTTCDRQPQDRLFLLAPGDDRLSSTLPDHPCWMIDDMARWTYGAIFELLSPRRQEQVHAAYENIMSYHAHGSETILLWPGQTVRTERIRFTQEQMDVMFDAAGTSRAAEVGREMQRNTGVSSYLDSEARKEERDKLVETLEGHWVADEGDTDWISWLQIRKEFPSWSPTEGIIYGAVDSRTFEWHGDARLRLEPSVYGDLVVAVPPPTEQTLTYTASLTHDNKLKVRIAGYSDNISPPFFEHNVVLVRPTPEQLCARTLCKIPGTLGSP